MKDMDVLYAMRGVCGIYRAYINDAYTHLLDNYIELKYIAKTYQRASDCIYYYLTGKTDKAIDLYREIEDDYEKYDNIYTMNLKNMNHEEIELFTMLVNNIQLFLSIMSKYIR